jgi:hypothetical protein
VRVGLAGVVIAGVCLAQLTSTSAADTAFNPGTASSGSQGIEIEPTTGSLSYAPIVANADADYENAEAQALAQTFDPGALVAALQGPSCVTGKPSSVPESDDPQPVQAESTSGNQTLTKDISDPAGIGAGVGTELAIATQQPAGTATNTIASEDYAGLIDVLGDTTNAVANLQNNNLRYANATVDMSSLSLAGGLVDLGGLHWVATQESGAKTASTASFDVTTLSIAGVPIKITGLSVPTITGIINTALEPTGLQVDWPNEYTQTDGTVVIAPLVIGIDNTALGQQVVGANLSKTESVRDQLESILMKETCQLDGEFTGTDIIIGVLAGGGDLNFVLGGAHAITTDAAFVSPFTPEPLSSGSLGAITAPIVAAIPPLTFSTPGTPGTPGTPAITPPVAAAAPTGSGKVVALGPTVKSASCHSTGPAGGGCDSSDVALPVGLIGLALLGGLAAWDYTRQRRRRRLAGLEA